MPEFLKSKLGMFLAGIYVLLIFYAVLEGIGTRPHSMDGLAFLILTAPWSFLLAFLFDGLGATSKDNAPFLYLYVAFGGLVNISILYLIGCLLTKLWKYLSSIGKKQ